MRTATWAAYPGPAEYLYPLVRTLHNGRTLRLVPEQVRLAGRRRAADRALHRRDEPAQLRGTQCPAAGRRGGDAAPDDARRAGQRRLGLLGMDFTVDHPPELVAYLGELARRYERSVSADGPAA